MYHVSVIKKKKSIKNGCLKPEGTNECIFQQRMKMLNLLFLILQHHQ